MVPPAPLLLSTTKGLPSSLVRRCPIVRATMSTVPPGGNGAIMVTGRVGQSTSAARAPHAQTNTASKARYRRVRTFVPCLMSSRLESVALELRLIELHAQARAGRQREPSAAEIQLGGDDVIHGLERTDTFEARQDAAAGRGQHDLRHGVDAEAEAMTDHHAQSRSGRRFHHAATFQKPALLHHLELHDVRALLANDGNEARVVGDG